MRAVIILGGIAIICLAIALLPPSKSGVLVKDRDKAVGMPRVLQGNEARTSDVPAIVEAMSRSSAAVNYAAFAFVTPDRPTDDDALNVQISVEKGRVGFDWVLLGSRNIEDQEKFVTFARTKGFEPVKLVMNGVSYLRIDSADAPGLVHDVVTEMYHVPENAALGLFHEGFDWPPPDKR
jgi:hypothetical protein